MAIWITGAVVLAGAAADANSARKSRNAQQNASERNDELTREQLAEDTRRYDLDRKDKWDLFNAQMAGDEEMDQRNRADKERSYQRVRGDNINTINRGDKAGNQLSYLMGLSDTGTGEKGWLSRQFGESDFVKDGGYNFRLKEGQTDVNNKMAASGNLLSGAAMKALTRFNQDYASNEYGQAYSRFNLDQDSQYNRLAGIQGAGQNAVNSVAGNSGTIQGTASNAMSGLANSLGQSNAQMQQASNNYYNNRMSNNNASANSQSAYNRALGNEAGGGMGTLLGAWNSYQKRNTGRSGYNYSGTSNNSSAGNYENSFDLLNY